MDSIVDLVESRDMYCLLLSKGSRHGSRSMRDGKPRGEALVDVAAETSAIEAGSAAVLVITYEDRDGNETTDARIEVAKGRFGSTGASLGMRFHGASGRWEELDAVPPTKRERLADQRVLRALAANPEGFRARTRWPARPVMSAARSLSALLGHADAATTAIYIRPESSRAAVDPRAILGGTVLAPSAQAGDRELN